VQGSTDQSANRQHKFTTQGKNRYAGNQKHNGVVSKQDAISNGVTHAVQSDVNGSKMEAKDSNLLGKEKVMAPFILKAHILWASLKNFDVNLPDLFCTFRWILMLQLQIVVFFFWGLIIICRNQVFCLPIHFTCFPIKQILICVFAAFNHNANFFFFSFLYKFFFCFCFCFFFL
jgi:sterol desaturase/sphingolipid hydroxylase (fatty acid hydroxylase superfamily)